MPFDGTKLEAKLPCSVQKTIANLQKARAYLDEHRWMQKVAIVYKDGDARRWPPVVPLRKDVSGVCALGAIYLAVPPFQRKAVMQALWTTIAKRYGVAMAIHKFNDQKNSKEEVLQLFEVAVDDLYEDALKSEGRHAI